MAGTITCGHCGKDHDEATKFCPETGKALGASSRPAGPRATMIMFQQPGSRLPGAGPNGHGALPADTTATGSAQDEAAAAGVVRPPTPASGLGVRSGLPAGAPRTTPSGGVPRSATPSSGLQRSRTPTGTPGVAPGGTPSTGIPVTITTRPSGRIQIPPPGASPREVPPPPVTLDGVPPPPVGAAVEPIPAEGSGARGSGPRRSKSLPDWVAAPQGGRAPIPSVVLPAVDAPPKGVADLLKDAFVLYRQHLKVFLTTAAVLYVPGAMISSAALALVAPSVDDPMSSPASVVTLTMRLLALLGWAVVAFVLYGLIIPLTSGALTITVADRVLGGERGWQDYWRMMLGRAGKLASALLPAAVLCALGTLFFVLPGLILCFFFALVPTVVLIEGQSGTAALKRSYELVKSEWLRVALVFLAFVLLSLVGNFIGGLLVSPRSVFLHALLGNLVTLVLLPVPVLATVLLYLDIRRKREGFDREALAAELEALRVPGQS